MINRVRIQLDKKSNPSTFITMAFEKSSKEGLLALPLYHCFNPKRMRFCQHKYLSKNARNAIIHIEKPPLISGYI